MGRFQKEAIIIGLVFLAIIVLGCLGAFVLPVLLK